MSKFTEYLEANKKGYNSEGYSDKSDQLWSDFLMKIEDTKDIDEAIIQVYNSKTLRENKTIKTYLEARKSLLNLIKKEAERFGIIPQGLIRKLDKFQ